MKNNLIIDNGNATSTIVIDSNKFGTKLVLIDTNKINSINHIKWCVNKTNTTKVGDTLYASGMANGKSVRLHRLLCNTPIGYCTDHINGDTLDNRLANLRVVSYAGNAFNQPRAKGYGFHKASGKYQSYIKINGKLQYLGLFDTSQEARAAYVAAKLKLHIIEEIK